MLDPGLVADAELSGLDMDIDDRDSSELGSRIYGGLASPR